MIPLWNQAHHSESYCFEWPKSIDWNTSEHFDIDFIEMHVPIKNYHNIAIQFTVFFASNNEFYIRFDFQHYVHPRWFVYHPNRNMPVISMNLSVMWAWLIIIIHWFARLLKYYTNAMIRIFWKQLKIITSAVSLIAPLPINGTLQWVIASSDVVTQIPFLLREKKNNNFCFSFKK